MQDVFVRDRLALVAVALQRTSELSVGLYLVPKVTE